MSTKSRKGKEKGEVVYLLACLFTGWGNANIILDVRVAKLFLEIH